VLLTPGAKVFAAIGGVALVLAIAGQVAWGDQVMVMLLLSLVAAAVMAAVTVAAGSRAPETAAVAASTAREAPPPEPTPVEPGRPARGGGWPALGAAAVAMVVLGFVLSPVLGVAGLLAGAVTIGGWLASASADHTGRDVNLLPVGIPVVGLLTIVSLMFFMSRVLLAVPEWASTATALVVTILIMGTASFLALKPSLSSRSLLTILATAAVVLLVAGTIAGAIGQRSEEGEKAGAAAAGPVSLVAQNLKFNTGDLTFKSGGDVEVQFNNKDSGTPHNFAMYTDSNATQALFNGDLAVGPLKIDYKFPAPPAGTYFFRCDVHPFMSGKVTVT
jgi:plastocyanin